MQEKILNKLQDAVQEETVVGAPTEVAGITFVPILSMIVGGSINSTTAGGGGVSLHPIAVIVIKKEEISYFVLGENTSEEEVKQRLPQILNKIEREN